MLPRWLIYFRALALASAFAAAFVPIATYITDDKRDWLWIHIGVNIAAYIAVALTTIYTTVNLTQQDHNKFSVPAYWANNVVMRTWYLGVSKTWRWHVAAAVGRLGLALALAQHIDTLIFDGESYTILTPHIYNGMTKTYPQWETVFIAFAVLIGFCVFEAALQSAFTVSFTSIRRIRIFYPVLVRFAIIFVFVQIMMFFDPPNFTYKDQYGYINYDKIVYQRGLVPWYYVAFNWFDDGTMMAAKILRPLESYECTQWGSSPTESGWVCSAHSSRPHIVVAIMQTLAAYATYILAIIASLQLAQYLHWRREYSLTQSPVSTP